LAQFIAFIPQYLYLLSPNLKPYPITLFAKPFPPSPINRIHQMKARRFFDDMVKFRQIGDANLAFEAKILIQDAARERNDSAGVA
jgi:hypothetical protein